MNTLSSCPYCNSELIIKEAACQGCHTSIRGTFNTNRFHAMNGDDLFFIEVFLKNEGNIKLMERDLHISYPTVKSRLKKIVQQLGYSISTQDPTERTSVLQKLSDGEITVKDAMKQLGKIK